MFDCGVLCVCLSFVSCNRVICMLLVCMKCVNCSILFLIPSMLLQYVYVMCSGVCSIVGRGVRGVVWRRERWFLGWSRGLMSPCWLCE